MRIAAIALLAASCATSAETLPEVVGVNTIAERIEAREGPLVVNFWASWCAPCMAEMPALHELAEEVEARGVRVQLVSLDLAQPIDVQNVEQLAHFMKRRDMTLPVWAFEGDAIELAERLNLPGPIPFTMVFGPSGEAQATHIGQATLDQFRELVDQALASS